MSKKKSSAGRKFRPIDQVRRLTVGMQVEYWDSWGRAAEIGGEEGDGARIKFSPYVPRQRYYELGAAAMQLTRRWKLEVFGKYRTRTGSEYFDTIEGEATCRLNELSEWRREERDKMKRSVDEVIDLGFRATALE